jgi:hypothetical protein
MTDESKNFIQMTKFSQKAFDYHLHLKLGHISMPQVNIHCVGNHFATFCCALGFLKFLTFSWSWFRKYGISLDDYSWLDHRGDERRNLIELLKLFLIDDILDSDDSSFFRYNHLKSFVYCVWNIENLCHMFC